MEDAGVRGSIVAAHNRVFGVGNYSYDEVGRVTAKQRQEGTPQEGVFTCNAALDDEGLGCLIVCIQ